MSVAIDEGLARVSLELVYGSIGMYTLAMGAYAVAAAQAVRAPAPAEQEDVAEVAHRPALVATPVAVAGDEPLIVGQVARGGEARAISAPTEGASWRKAAGIGTSLSVLADALLLAAIITRGLAAGRPPWGNMYEFSLVGCFVIGTAFLGFALTDRRRQLLGIFVIPLVLLALGLGVTVLYVDAEALLPALHSSWLVIHVTAAIVSSGAFCFAGVISAVYLVQERAERVAPGGRLARLLPPSRALDTLSYRVIAFTFPLWTFAIIAGAIWAENAWGRYWGWDPKETWAFITWVIYAAYLHARATAGWRGRGAAFISLAGFAAMTFNLFGVNLFITGLHSYAGV
ncbi:MAG TPA: c-type cytochrome biogenesis protein CcsB [Actinomycetes bacterium]|nr:c-type cytochrome biogenesis protein CcsB [Actinomycetes bacterium]